MRLSAIQFTKGNQTDVPHLSFKCRALLIRLRDAAPFDACACKCYMYDVRISNLERLYRKRSCVFSDKAKRVEKRKRRRSMVQ